LKKKTCEERIRYSVKGSILTKEGHPFPLISKGERKEEKHGDNRSMMTRGA